MILAAFICFTLWVTWNIYRLFAYRTSSIEGKVVLVTGACSELGRRLCLQLHANGAHVIAWDYNKSKLDVLRNEALGITAAASVSSNNGSALDAATAAAGNVGGGSRARAYGTSGLSAATSSTLSSPSPASSIPVGSDGAVPEVVVDAAPSFTVVNVDVSSRLQIQRAISDSADRVDILINAAHSYPPRPLQERGDDTVERVFQTNVLCGLLLWKHIVPHMLKRPSGGHIVTVVAAAAGQTQSGDSPDYAASQWAAVGAHYSMRRSVREQYQQGRRGRQQQQKHGAAPTLAPHNVQGEVRTTLLCLDAVQAPPPSTLGLTVTMSAYGRAPSPVTASLSTSATDSIVGGGSAASAPLSASQAAALALDKRVAQCLSAVYRGEERYCESSSDILYSALEVLPVPWYARVTGWLLRKPRSVLPSE